MHIHSSKLFISLIGFILLTPLAAAETVSLEYTGFYDRLKRVNTNNYQYVEVAFSVPMTTDCTILSGKITTDTEVFPLTYTKQQRLYLPYDPQLKTDRGIIHLEVSGDSSQCGIAMQVRAKKTQLSYSNKELIVIVDDMNALLDGQQGFPMKYFRKPISGLTFEFASGASTDKTIAVLIDGVSSDVNHKLQLTNEQITNIKQISFSQTPTVVSPFVQQ